MCGDTVMAGGAMGGIFGSGSLGDYIQSLASLHACGPAVLLPGHGRVSEEGVADLGIAMARSRALLADTRALFRAMGGDERAGPNPAVGARSEPRGV